MSKSLPIAIFLASLAGSQPALADTYPSHPISIVVPSAAGGPTDILARLLAEQMSTEFKQTVIVENRPGAATNIGVAAVARAKPDGYTILCTIDTPLTVNPSLYKNPGFDPNKDLTPISLATRFAQMLVLNPSVPANTLSEFIALSKQTPQTYASSGTGSPSHLVGSLFAQKTHAQLVQIPYKGAAQAVTDLLGGQVAAGFLPTAGVLAHVASGKLKALGITSAKRSELSPSTPTFAEGGLSNFEATFAMVFMAPAATSPEIVAKLNSAIKNGLANPKVRARLLALDMEPVGGSPDETRAYLRHYEALWSGLVKAQNIRPD